MKSISAALGLLVAVGSGSAMAQDDSAWTGLYAGLEAGYSNTDIGPMWDNTSSNLSALDDINELAGGVVAGYNAQASEGLIVGIESDILLHDVEERSGPSDDGFSFASDMLWSLSARAGFEISDQAMLYVKGGYSLMDFDTELIVGTSTASDGGWLHGFHAGGGLEYMVSQSVSLKAEYRYINFASESVASPTPVASSVDPSLHLGLVGINLHF